MTQINISNLSVSYTHTLIKNLTLTIPRGWTGISGPNGCGKTSLIHCIIAALKGRNDKFITEELQWNGEISGPSTLYYIPQMPEPDQADLMEFFYNGDNDCGRISSLLELKEEWLYHLDDISQGQKRRLQLALALSENPEILILDEPENHLDQAGRNLVINTLRQYRGIGIIIGHSRSIMNSLCTSTILIYQKRWHYYHHGLSKSMELYKEEEQSIRKQRQIIKSDIIRQKMQLTAMVQNAAKGERALSKKGLSRHDNDKKSAIDLARVSGADKASSGKISVQKGIITAGSKELDSLKQDKLWKLGLTILGQKSRRDHLIRIAGGRYSLYENFTVDLPELSVRPSDFIVVKGANGSGKTGLLKLIHQRIDPAVRLGWIPQELSDRDKEELLINYNHLNKEERADVLAYFSRMGSDPAQWMEQQTGSPGEYRKLLLAMTFLQETELLILDEPANHLDIFTIQVIEEAMKNFSAAVIMVSHEEEFCSGMSNTEWILENGILQIFDKE